MSVKTFRGYKGRNSQTGVIHQKLLDSIEELRPVLGGQARGLQTSDSETLEKSLANLVENLPFLANWAQSAKAICLTFSSRVILLSRYPSLRSVV